MYSLLVHVNVRHTLPPNALVTPFASITTSPIAEKGQNYEGHKESIGIKQIGSVLVYMHVKRV